VRKYRENYSLVGFEILTAVAGKSYVFWDVTPFGLVKVNRRFGGSVRQKEKKKH
jgi:hypothetical protein